MPQYKSARCRRSGVLVDLLESRVLCSGGDGGGPTPGGIPPSSVRSVWANRPPASERAPTLASTFDVFGLSKLSYNGWDYYDRSRTETLKPQLYNWNLIQNGVEHRNVFAGTQVSQYNAATKTVDVGVPWAGVLIHYTAGTDRLTYDITVTNTARDGTIIEGFNLFLNSLVFPPSMKFDQGQQMTFNYEQPGVVAAQDQNSTVAIAMETVRQRIGVGYMGWGYITSQFNEFPVRIGTAEIQGQSGYWPVYNSNILPGQQQTYRVSLRFGIGQQTVQAIAPDVFTNYAAANPKTLVWTDKRPLGQVALFDNGVSTSKVDLTAPNAIATFHDVALTFADQTVAALKASNAQGAIFWDMEGNSQPRATYVGDPRQTARITPAMDAVADQFYKKFTDAGLRIGMTIRPTQVAWDAQGAFQQAVADPTAELQAKVNYCRSRWGATLFYVDSAKFFNPDWIQPVASANPDCLFVVENPSPAVYAFGAGYLDMRRFTQPDTSARALYPTAFSAQAVGDGPGPSRVAVNGGIPRESDIVLYHGATVIPAEYSFNRSGPKREKIGLQVRVDPPLKLTS